MLLSVEIHLLHLKTPQFFAVVSHVELFVVVAVVAVVVCSSIVVVVVAFGNVDFESEGCLYPFQRQYHPIGLMNRRQK